jgi:hypothetical protein
MTFSNVNFSRGGIDGVRVPDGFRAGWRHLKQGS